VRHASRSVNLSGAHVGNVPVFYNVYADPNHPSLASEIVEEQMGQLRPEHKVLVRSIGARLGREAFDGKDFEHSFGGARTLLARSVAAPVYGPHRHRSVTFLQHNDTGDETGTLKYLWMHCQDNEDTVVYIHDKGSFHPTETNTLLRKFITRGALSEECSNMPASCNVCSSRMSPLPHPHTSGNMWAAKCNYIRKLFDPSKFAAKMSLIYGGGENSCIGTGRYAAEHWVHSHPSVKPCDLSANDKFMWGYGHVPNGESEMKLGQPQQAPRYEWAMYVNLAEGCDWDLKRNLERLRKEYKDLSYGEPDASWWAVNKVAS